MQDELKKVISEALNTSAEEQELIEQFAEGELSDEALETVAGGFCRADTTRYVYNEYFWTSRCTWNAGKLK
jgi:hypothetical protein